MATHRRWIHSRDVLKSSEDSSVAVPHPSLLTEWVDDMKLWPDVSYIDIINYLVFSATLAQKSYTKKIFCSFL